MFRPVLLILTCCAFVCLTACESDKDDTASPPIKIEGFQLFDLSGNPMGHIGPVDSDWQFINWTSLSALEQSILNTTDTTNTANTLVTSVSIQPYPNPVNDYSAIYIHTGDSVKFKLIITDHTGTVLKQYSNKIKGAAPMMIDLSDNNLYPNKKSLRYYYSFSAESNPHFKVGYGDIKICDYDPAQQPVTECFQ